MGILGGALDPSRWFQNRRDNSALFLCGGTLLALAIAMVPSLIVAIRFGESIRIIGIPIVIGFIVGTPIFTRYRLGEVVRPPDALTMMAVMWVTCFLFGMLPFLMCGLSVVDSLFESASGFTTTGVDVVNDLTLFPMCIRFWRCTTTWIGGIMIILIFMLLMPMVGGGTRNALGNETSGSSGAYNRSMRLKDAAMQFIMVYMLLTLVMTFVLVLMSYTIFDAVSIAFSTISNGGFLASPIEFTLMLKVVVMTFMLLGATNFYLHYRAFYQGNVSVYKRSTEFKGTLIWCFTMSVVLFLILNPDIFSVNVFERYVDSLFMVISASSTGGFSYDDFGTWSYSAMAVLYLMAFVGASSGSTAGGIKISRLIISLKAIGRSFSQIVRPNAVVDITMDGNKVPIETIRSTFIVIMFFICTIFAFALLFMLLGYNGTESLSCSIALISNFGSAVGQFGPSTGYGAAPDLLKLIMILMMWIGRLEILVALAILSPRLWKDQYREFKYNRWKSSQ